MAMACKKISTALNYSFIRHAKRLSSMTPVSLIGPPEIYQKPILSYTEKRDPFMENVKIPPMGLTENGSPTFLSTGDPCLDFFFHVVPDTPPETLTRRLELAWEHDPLKALKLVCNLRAVKGTGKSDREGGYTAALWLHKHHPKTLACNADSFACFGYLKDLLEILFRILEGPDARKLSKSRHAKTLNENNVDKSNENESESKPRTSEHTRSHSDLGVWNRPPRLFGRHESSHGILHDLAKRFGMGNSGLAELNENSKCQSSKEKWEEMRKTRSQEKRIQQAKRAVERFNSDPDFKFLHDRVSDHFAKLLRSDMKMLSAGNMFKISLAAKWCPSLDKTYDRVTLLCETIAKKVFPRDEYPEYDEIEEAHYAYRVRDRLRKQVLVPLRKALELPEIYITANDWGSVRYHRVASVAMTMYKQRFLEHDGERFQEYLAKVSEGKAKIASGALLPHKIIADLSGPDGGQVAELQWKSMVDKMAKKGKLNNCLAICDVSTSMSGTPMDVSVALGVLVSELSDEPWKGKLITFSAYPELQTVVGNSLKEKTEFVRRMDWGLNTDFQKVFDLLLQVAVDGKLKPEQMIKRLFVFSDMEFDQALKPFSRTHHYHCHNGELRLIKNETLTDQNRTWETDYEAIVRKFREKGYGECVPEIVFWNLRDSEATPVPSNQPGVALVSGYSKNLMTLFQEGGRTKDPVAVMDAAISGWRYNELQVFD